jgi:hypothetical protein
MDFFFLPLAGKPCRGKENKVNLYLQGKIHNSLVIFLGGGGAGPAGFDFGFHFHSPDEIFR